MTNAQNASISSTPVSDDPTAEPTRLRIGIVGLQAAVPMPVAGLVHDRLVAMMARGWADLDWAALGLLAAVEAGLDGEQGGKS